VREATAVALTLEAEAPDAALNRNHGCVARCEGREREGGCFGVLEALYLSRRSRMDNVLGLTSSRWGRRRGGSGGGGGVGPDL
jgi:hypothetical protein